jgi:ParB family chromosome partitioning protein
VVRGELSEGHARALLGAPDEQALAELAERVIKGHLNVRQTEGLVRQSKAEQKGGKAGTQSKSKSAGVRDLEGRLERKLGARCEVRDRDGKGELVVRYANWEDLDRILELIL